MVWLIGLSLMGLMATGVYFDLRPPCRARSARRWFRATVSANLLLFVAAEIALLVFAVENVMAQPIAETAGSVQVSPGLGLALIGIGIPTGLATVGAGIAVGPVGASALAVISEKPEMFGRTLIYLGLAEGIAIYGLVVTILLLDKIA